MKLIDWTPPARADVRRIDRTNAMRILTALHRFAETGEGDIKKLQGDSEELRLRVGDYRVRFTEEPHDTLIIHSVWSARLALYQSVRENWTRRAYGTRQEIPA